jgi:chromosome partitioning protein
LARQVEAEVRQHFGDQVFRPVIPRNVRISESPSHGVPVVLYDRASRGAVAYRTLAREVSASTRVAASEGAIVERKLGGEDAEGVG